jgi:hypothetical protein
MSNFKAQISNQALMTNDTRKGDGTWNSFFFFDIKPFDIHLAFELSHWSFYPDILQVIIS